MFIYFFAYLVQILQNIIIIIIIILAIYRYTNPIIWSDNFYDFFVKSLICCNREWFTSDDNSILILSLNYKYQQLHHIAWFFLFSLCGPLNTTESFLFLFISYYISHKILLYPNDTQQKTHTVCNFLFNIYLVTNITYLYFVKIFSDQLYIV